MVTPHFEWGVINLPRRCLLLSADLGSLDCRGDFDALFVELHAQRVNTVPCVLFCEAFS